MAISDDNIEAWLEDLSNIAEDELSSWELDFVEDIADRFTSTKELTERQQEKLKEVWERHFE